MKDEMKLSFSELLSLDALIAVAQERGLKLTDRVKNDQDQAEAAGELHAAMWEARHGGLELSGHDREILAKIRDLASQLEIAPTLGQLIELRGEAIRQQGGG